MLCCFSCYIFPLFSILCLIFNFMRALFPYGIVAVVSGAANGPKSLLQFFKNNNQSSHSKERREQQLIKKCNVASRYAKHKKKSQSKGKQPERQQKRTKSAKKGNVKCSNKNSAAFGTRCTARSHSADCAAAAPVVSLGRFFKSALFAAPALELSFECFYVHLK